MVMPNEQATFKWSYKLPPYSSNDVVTCGYRNGRIYNKLMVKYHTSTKAVFIDNAYKKRIIMKTEEGSMGFVLKNCKEADAAPIGCNFQHVILSKVYNLKIGGECSSLNSCSKSCIILLDIMLYRFSIPAQILFIQEFTYFTSHFLSRLHIKPGYLLKF